MFLQRIRHDLFKKNDKEGVLTEGSLTLLRLLCRANLPCIYHGLFHKILHVPSTNPNPGFLGDRRKLFYVTIKAGLYRKAVQVCDIPDYLRSVTFSPHQDGLHTRNSRLKSSIQNICTETRLDFTEPRLDGPYV